MNNYSTKITDIGTQVNELERNSRMIVVFNDSIISDELREIAVLHTSADLPGEVKVGDYVAFGNRSYEITAVGKEAIFTLRTAGHCTFVFNGAKEVKLPHQISLDKNPPLPKLKVGDLFEIIYQN